MEWYNYVSIFFAGAFISNFVPHFVKGVCGDNFPTPFAKPPGRGPSSPVVNVLWALLNLVIGCLLYKVGKMSCQDNISVGVFFVGFALLAIMAATNFAKKEKM
jgi:hypothetical protein